MSEQAPKILAGRYEIHDLIGRGGMAEVYIGRDNRLGRTVAIKLLRSDLAIDTTFQSRFRREAQAAASLNHPAIVSVYDTGEDMTTDAAGNTVHLPFIIMEYVEGHTVRELAHDGIALPIDEAVDITIGVLSALQYAHHMGIVHRDIKPANIMITSSGQAKVMDFGIARALADSVTTMTQSQAVIGTAQYLSPEQARGELVDSRSDLYSTGCVLYELLAGRPPFIGDSAVSIAYQHVREMPAPPSAHNPNIPAVMDRIVLKALSKERNRRYQTAQEFLIDLETVKDGGIPAAASAQTATTLMPAAATAAPATQVLGAPVTAGPSPIPALTDVLPQPLPETEEDDEQHGKGWIIILVAAIVAVIAVICLLVWLFSGHGPKTPPVTSPATTSISTPTPTPTPTVQVPQIDPNTTTAAQAKQALQNLGLNPQESDQASNTVPKGNVIAFNPPSGTLVPVGSTVTYQVSTGPSTVAVPDVTNQSQNAAAQTLSAAPYNFTVKWGTQQNSAKIPQGFIVSTDPKAGTQVAPGSTITIYASTGMAKVPSLASITCAPASLPSCPAAETYLNEAGFQLDGVTLISGSGEPAGTILSQDPAAGSLVSSMAVGINVSDGTAAPTPTPTPNNPFGPGPQNQ